MSPEAVVPLRPALQPAGDDRLRVLLWHWGRRGGGPGYTLELARKLMMDPSIELHLSLSRQSELFRETAALGLPCHDVDTYSSVGTALLATGRLPAIRRRFRNYLVRHRIQVVNCTMMHLWNYWMLPAIASAGARYVLTIHDALLHPGERNPLRMALMTREIARADTIITLSDHVRRQVIDFHGVPPHRIHVVPHGVFGENGMTDHRQAPAGRPFRLLFFGRILPYKGLDLLLDAYRLLRESADVELTIAGSGDIGPYLSRLRDLPGVHVENRWIAEDEIQGFFARADAVVTPYVEASQSGVITTAFGAGLPVVSTPVGGLVEQLRHGRAGLIAEAVDAPSFAKALRRLLEEPGLYEKLSRSARNEATTTMSWTTIAETISRLLSQRTGGSS
jgi:glycosyltransferase involved in cell wall biosynthesis